MEKADDEFDERGDSHSWQPLASERAGTLEMMGPGDAGLAFRASSVG